MADPSIGGAILGEACHFVDLFYWLLDSEPVAVSAFTLPTNRAHPIGENNLAASFRFRDGSVANLTYCTVGSATSGGERVEVFGEGVGVSTEDFTRLDVRHKVRHSQSKWWPDKGYSGLVGSFMQAIRDGTSPPVTVRDGARATIGCLEMLESARSFSPRSLDIERSLGAAD
jgi:predicted dehydrogenase